MHLRRDAAFGEINAIRDKTQDVVQRRVEGLVNGREQFRRGFFLPTPDLRQTPERDPRIRRDFTQRPTLALPILTQHLTELATQKRLPRRHRAIGDPGHTLKLPADIDT